MRTITSISTGNIIVTPIAARPGVGLGAGAGAEGVDGGHAC